MNKKSRITLPISAGEHAQLSRELLKGLSKLFPGQQVVLAEAFGQQRVFRQVDILLSCAGEGLLDLSRIPAELGAAHCDDFGNVLVMDVPTTAQRFSRLARVVVRVVPERTFDFARKYYAFGEHGALIGRIAFRVGLALRDDGLFYYFRDGDMRFKDICLTTDYEQALAFLGFDVETHKKGFQLQAELFQSVTRSLYFNEDAFHGQLSTQDTEGGEVLLMLQDFYEWRSQQDELPACPAPENIKVLIPRIGAYFPAFLREYTRTSKELTEIQILSTRLHPRNLAQLTGLKGHTLGAAIRQFKNSFNSREELCDYMMAATDEDLVARMLTKLAA